MLTVKFTMHRKSGERTREVRAIILDEAVKGIQGIVECCTCEWRGILDESDDSNAIGNAIEKFAWEHPCGLKPTPGTKARILDHLRKDHGGESKEE